MDKHTCLFQVSAKQKAKKFALYFLLLCLSFALHSIIHTEIIKRTAKLKYGVGYIYSYAISPTGKLELHYSYKNKEGIYFQTGTFLMNKLGNNINPQSFKGACCLVQYFDRDPKISQVLLSNLLPIQSLLNFGVEYDIKDSLNKP
ncbi:MAG: hypothetical protein CFE21_04405 [Bacteroidetes bacterium B1(2017)]|nr:MAG: hypothetical protein CFE21_04405 [Bacteroidetes bacterium B1(2017)]